MLNSIKIPIYGEKPEGGYYFQIYFSNIFCGIICKKQKNVKKIWKPSARLQKKKNTLKLVVGGGESGRLRLVLKTVVLRGTRGSNPCLSATNAENQ